MSSTRLGKASAQQPGRQEANPSLPDSDLCSELPCPPTTLRARAVTRAHLLILGSKLPARSHGVTFQQQALGLVYGLYFFSFSVARHHFHSQFKTPSTTEEKSRERERGDRSGHSQPPSGDRGGRARFSSSPHSCLAGSLARKGPTRH